MWKHWYSYGIGNTLQHWRRRGYYTDYSASQTSIDDLQDEHRGLHHPQVRYVNFRTARKDLVRYLDREHSSTVRSALRRIKTFGETHNMAYYADIVFKVSHQIILMPAVIYFQCDKHRSFEIWISSCSRGDWKETSTWNGQAALVVGFGETHNLITVGLHRMGV